MKFQRYRFLRISLELDKEGVEEDGKGCDAYHEDGTRPGLDTITFHSSGYSSILEDCKSDQEYGTVHFPLAFGVGQGIELKERNTR